MTRFLTMFLTLPVWAVVRLCDRFLASDHPWKGRKFTLSEWAEGATLFNVALGFWFWLSFQTFIIVGVRLWLGN